MQLTLISLTPDDLRQVIREEVARAVSQPAASTAEQPSFLTIDQAADRHGVSKSYLYRLSSQRAVTTRKVGKNLQFEAKGLEALFEQQTKKSLAAIDADLKRTGVFPTLEGSSHV